LFHTQKTSFFFFFPVTDRWITDDNGIENTVLKSIALTSDFETNHETNQAYKKIIPYSKVTLYGAGRQDLSFPVL
jgi:hypothetical protein